MNETESDVTICYGF